MKYKRPCLWMAVAFVLGECLPAASILPVPARLFLAAALLFLLLGSYYQQKINLPGLFLLLIFSGAACFRFQKCAAAMDKSWESIQSFGDFRTILEGTVEECRLARGKLRVTVRDARLSSAYGSLESLPEDASPALRARYQQDVGKILVYLDEEASMAYLGGNAGRDGDAGSGNAGGNIRGMYGGNSQTGGDMHGIRNKNSQINGGSRSGHIGLYPGQEVSIEGEMAELSPPRNEGEFDFPLYYRGMGIHGTMYGKSCKITGGSPLPFRKLVQDTGNRLSEALRGLCEEEDNGVYQAVLLGNKTEMDEDLRELYQKNGIAHILAVSGLHLSIIGGGFYSLLRSIGLSQISSGFLGGFLIIFYGILSGSSGSAIRAVIMLLLRFLSVCLGKSYDMLSALSVSCILLLWASPYLLFTAAFQLSFLAVLSLGLYQELMEGGGRRKKTGNALLATLSASCFLQLFTLPAILFHSFQFPLYSILLNLLVLPLMSYVVYSGLAALAFGSLANGLGNSLSNGLANPLANALGGRMAHTVYNVLWKLGIFSIGGGHYLLRFYTLLCQLFSAFPKANATLGRPKIEHILAYYALLLAAWYLLVRQQKKGKGGEGKTAEEEAKSHRKRELTAKEEREETAKHQKENKTAGAERKTGSPGGARACFLSACLLLAALYALLPAPPKELEITALDVGQGDGFLIRFGGRLISIDNGSTTKKGLGEQSLEPYLLSQGLTHIDCALITHCDQDHCSGIEYLLSESREISIGTLLLPACAEGDSRYDGLRQAAETKGTYVSYCSAGEEILIDGNAKKDTFLPHAAFWEKSDPASEGWTGQSARGGKPLRLICLYPTDASYIEDANSHSATLCLSYGKFQMLFTGDLPKEQEAEVLENLAHCFPLAAGEQVEILKAGHHGSKTSTSPELLSYLKPSFALLSYGIGNRYGHPHAETLDLLEEHRISLLESGKSGEIRITSDGQTYRIGAPLA